MCQLDQVSSDKESLTWGRGKDTEEALCAELFLKTQCPQIAKSLQKS